MIGAPRPRILPTISTSPLLLLDTVELHLSRVKEFYTCLWLSEMTPSSTTSAVRAAVVGAPEDLSREVDGIPCYERYLAPPHDTISTATVQASKLHDTANRRSHAHRAQCPREGYNSRIGSPVAAPDPLVPNDEREASRWRRC